MSNGTCKTCKWWVKKDTHYGNNANMCANPKIVGPHKDHPADADGAELCDASGYFAAILPGPDFGCIHHEPKA